MLKFVIIKNILSDNFINTLKKNNIVTIIIVIIFFNNKILNIEKANIKDKRGINNLYKRNKHSFIFTL
jgi:hypothetical protein